MNHPSRSLVLLRCLADSTHSSPTKTQLSHMPYLRFIVHQKIPGTPRQAGLFTAAYDLRDEGELSRYDRDFLDRLLAWFSSSLPVPPAGKIPSQAIFWYRQGGLVFKQMWVLAKLLNKYNFTTELIKTSFAGLVVYQDEHQVAAIPRGGKRR